MYSLSGLILAFVALTIPFLSSTIRENAKLRGAVVLAMLSHQLVSIAQITVGPLPTINGDPVAFNWYALRDPRGDPLRGNPYANLLRDLYDTVGGSKLLGCEISQFFFALSLVILVWLICHFALEDYGHWIILTYALLPSCMLNSSATLRESSQMFGMLGLAYSCLRLREHGWDRYCMLFPICAFSLVRIHNGFSPYILVAFPLVFFWITTKRNSLIFVTAFICIVFAPLLGPKITRAVKARSVALQRIVDGRALEYVESYSKGVNESRTSFTIQLDFSNPTRAVETGLARYAQYLFAPFPWDLRGIKDSYGLFECSLRLSLCFLAFLAVWRSSGTRKQEVICLLYLFFIMEAVWAAGTANWGTAFRHRLPAWGYLVLCGFYGWSLGRENEDGSNTKEAEPTPKASRARTKSEGARARRREIARKHSEKLDRHEKLRKKKNKS